MKRCHGTHADPHSRRRTVVDRRLRVEERDVSQRLAGHLANRGTSGRRARVGEPRLVLRAPAASSELSGTSEREGRRGPSRCRLGLAGLGRRVDVRCGVTRGGGTEPGSDRPPVKCAFPVSCCALISRQRDEMSGVRRNGSTRAAPPLEGQRCDDRPSDLGDDVPSDRRRALLQRGETDERVSVLSLSEPEHHRLGGSGEAPLSSEMLCAGASGRAFAVAPAAPPRSRGMGTSSVRAPFLRGRQVHDDQRVQHDSATSLVSFIRRGTVDDPDLLRQAHESSLRR